jgi:PQQ-like domain
MVAAFAAMRMTGYSTRFRRVVVVLTLVVVVAALTAVVSDSSRQAVVRALGWNIDATVSHARPASAVGTGSPKDPKRRLWRGAYRQVEVLGGYALGELDDGVSVRDVRSGAERWHFRFDEEAGGERYGTSAIGDGLVAIVSGVAEGGEPERDSNTLRIFDLRSGRERWSKEVNIDIESVSISAGTVVVTPDPVDKADLTAFAAKDGRQLWRHHFSDACDFSGSTAREANTTVLLVYTGCTVEPSRPTVTVIDRITGKPRGQIRLPAPPPKKSLYLSAAWSGGLAGTAFFFDEDDEGTVSVTDQQGRRLWRHTWPIEVDDSPPERPRLLFSDQPEALCLIRELDWGACWTARTGEPLWEGELQARRPRQGISTSIIEAGAGELSIGPLAQRFDVTTGRPTAPFDSPPGTRQITHLGDGVMVVENPPDMVEVYAD